MQPLIRRRVVAGTIGIGTGAFAAGRWAGQAAAGAQEATPAVGLPMLG